MTFDAHFFAVASQTGYDPLVGRPIDLKNYSQAAFEESVEPRLAATPHQLRAQIEYAKTESRY